MTQCEADMIQLNFVLDDGVLHTLWLMESSTSALAWASELGARVAWVK